MTLLTDVNAAVHRLILNGDACNIKPGYQVLPAGRICFDEILQRFMNAFPHPENIQLCCPALQNLHRLSLAVSTTNFVCTKQPACLHSNVRLLCCNREHKTRGFQVVQCPAWTSYAASLRLLHNPIANNPVPSQPSDWRLLLRACLTRCAVSVIFNISNM